MDSKKVTHDAKSITLWLRLNCTLKTQQSFPCSFALVDDVSTGVFDYNVKIIPTPKLVSLEIHFQRDLIQFRLKLILPEAASTYV